MNTEQHEDVDSDDGRSEVGPGNSVSAPGQVRRSGSVPDAGPSPSSSVGGSNVLIYGPDQAAALERAREELFARIGNNRRPARWDVPELSLEWLLK